MRTPWQRRAATSTDPRASQGQGRTRRFGLDDRLVAMPHGIATAASRPNSAGSGARAAVGARRRARMSASAGEGSIAGARPDASRGLLTQQQQQRRRQRRQHQGRQQQREQSKLDAKDRSQLLRPHTVQPQTQSQRSSQHDLSPVREKWARIKTHLQKEHSQSTLELPRKVAPSQPCTFGYRTPMFLKPGGGGEPKQYFRCALSHTQAPTLCVPLPPPLSLTRPLLPASSHCPLPLCPGA